jgi:hypothetical protein
MRLREKLRPLARVGQRLLRPRVVLPNIGGRPDRG